MRLKYRERNTASAIVAQALASASHGNPLVMPIVSIANGGVPGVWMLFKITTIELLRMCKIIGTQCDLVEPRALPIFGPR